MASDTTWEFPPHVLREYALLADGERGVLVGPRGDFVWMCAPRWDSDAVFSSLIGGHGSYAVTPTGRFVWGGYYEDGSLIWRSRWTTETGVVECREALAFPGEPGRAVLLRRIIACAGQARVRVLLDPRAGGHDDHVLAMEISLAAGEHHDLVLELSEQTLPDAPPDPDQTWEATAYTWNATVPELSDTVAQPDARHGYAVLRGLTSSGGGMVAAATMSLPERAEQGRNYDYRYVWIRDQCFTGQAIAAAGPHPLLDDAVRFVAERILADGPQLMRAYTVTGGTVPDQCPLGLPGYPGGHDLVGNQVNAQFQLDAFGESLLLLAAAARHGHLDADPRCAAGQRPPYAGHPAGAGGGARPRQLPLPVPTTTWPARRRRGRVPALRVHHGPPRADVRRCRPPRPSLTGPRPCLAPDTTGGPHHDPRPLR